MDATISEVLYDWMLERRIVSDVARRMGIPVSTLSAELRPENSAAKLGADSLVPLFRAIRKAGYGDELEGILSHFVGQLHGEKDPRSKDLVPEVLQLCHVMGALAGCVDVSDVNTCDESLRKIEVMIRTQVLPSVLRLQSVVTKRRKILREEEERLAKAARRRARQTAQPILQTLDVIIVQDATATA